MTNTSTLWKYDNNLRKFYVPIDLSYYEYTYNDVNNITSGEEYLITSGSENNTLNSNLANISFNNRNFNNNALWTFTNENGGYSIKNGNNYLSSVDGGNNGAALYFSSSLATWRYDDTNHAFYRQTLINYVTYSYNHANYINSGSNYYITNGDNNNLIALSVNGNNLTYFDMTDNEPTNTSSWLLNNYNGGYTIRNVSNNRYLYCSNNGTLSTNTNSRTWMYDANNHRLYYQRNYNNIFDITMELGLQQLMLIKLQNYILQQELLIVVIKILMYIYHLIITGGV